MWICWAQLLPGRNPAWFFLRMKSTSSLILFKSILLYDTTLFKPIVTPSDLVDFQSDIDSIHDWFSLNHLTASASKTKLMIISTKRDPFLPDVALTFNNQPIERVSSTNFLTSFFLKKALGIFLLITFAKRPVRPLASSTGPSILPPSTPAARYTLPWSVLSLNMPLPPDIPST